MDKASVLKIDAPVKGGRRISGPLRRIHCNSVSDTLIQAIENAESMKRVVVIYEAKDEEDYAWGIFLEQTTRLSWLNFMLDMVKAWIFS